MLALKAKKVTQPEQLCLPGVAANKYSECVIKQRVESCEGTPRQIVWAQLLKAWNDSPWSGHCSVSDAAGAWMMRGWKRFGSGHTTRDC
eukprot:1158006-Pelagomonas_calceolata.AAC.8